MSLGILGGMNRALVSAAIVVGLGGCGSVRDPDQPDGGGPPDAAQPDVVTATVITISLHRSFPYVDGDTENAELVAFQDGDSPWQALIGAGGVYTATVSGQRYGVAVGCHYDPDLYTSLDLFHSTITEEPHPRRGACTSTPIERVEVSGTITGIEPGRSASIRLRQALTSLRQDGPYSLSVPKGRTDLFGVLRAGTFSNTEPTKIVRVPAIDLQADQSISVDFRNQGAAPVRFPLTTSTLSADELAYVSFSVRAPTNPGSFSSYALYSSLPVPTTHEYAALPAALRQTGDLYVTSVRATGSAGSRSSARYVATPGPVTADLPLGLDAPTPALLQQPYLRPVFAFSTTEPRLAGQRYFADAYSINETTGVYRDWFVELSPGWIGGQSAIQYTMPDLTAIPGWTPTFALERRLAIGWSVQRSETSADAVTAGYLSETASAAGTIGEYCGDGVPQTGETCDTGGDSPTCDADCTTAVCGDGYLNVEVEQCDPPDGAVCSATCTAL